MNYEKIYIYIIPSINMLNKSYSLPTLISMLNKYYFFLKINMEGREGKKNLKNRERKEKKGKGKVGEIGK